MDYTEMLFALEVRKIARKRMIKDVHDKFGEEIKSKSSAEYYIFLEKN